MGSQCKSITPSHPNPNNLRYELHPAFGQIHLLQVPTQTTPKAYKKLSSSMQSMIDNFKQRVEFASDCQNSISTLVEVYDFQKVGGEDMQKCQGQDNFILVDFRYYPPQQTLLSVLSHKTERLSRLGVGLRNQAQSISLYDYSSIDRLPSTLRQVVNLYYQEIQIVRMIDHIVGALYFLHHFDVEHGGIRPQMIMLDQEGRFILVERDIFQRESNFDLAKAKLAEGEVFQYLSPQGLTLLKQGVPTLSSTQKLDIFCVGLIALQMCLLQPVALFQHSPSSATFNPSQLQHYLSLAKQRYSPALIGLLQQMLSPHPSSRLDYIDLIDNLNPLLMQNLDAIKKIHQSRSVSRAGLTQGNSQMEKTFSQEGEGDLRDKLLRMEQGFQKVMRSRVVLERSSPNQQQLQEEEQELLNKLSKVRTTGGKIEHLSSTNRGHNPENLRQYAVGVSPFQLGSANEAPPNKRYISGGELQAIVLKEYQQIKTRRQLGRE